jgi:2-oxoglutarate dehydrogenase E2 component (dihydrolipoamide succinyltransferase)
MAKFEIIMPKLGESITEATITKWLKQPGDQVSEDDPIAEIATDKVDSEIPSPVEGVLKELLFNEGDTVEVGKIIALIEMDGDEEADKAGDVEDSQEELKMDKSTGKAKSPDAGEVIEKDAQETKTDDDSDQEPESGRFYSPLVRNIAKEEGIGMKELDKISGTGKEGRLTKDDILNYLKTRTKGEPVKAEEKKQPQEAPKAETSKQEPAKAARHTPEVKAESGDEVVEMSRLRKLIVDHMVMSEDTSVHVTSIAEFDVTNLVNWREKHKKAFEKREGEKLTFTPLFLWAIAKTIKDYPMINSSVSGNNIILRKNINIGMAAALPDGNLIVPVIKNADHKSILGLAKNVNDLAGRARNGKLMPDEIQGGTFTLTNLGTFDTLFATPVINQPQVAILGTGAIKKKPVVIENEYGDIIAIRSMMYLSLSYDHRIIDGALGGMVLKRIGEYLQNWDINQPV